MKKISRYVCTLALGTATGPGYLHPSGIGHHFHPAITSANTIWVTDLTQATAAPTSHPSPSAFGSGEPFQAPLAPVPNNCGGRLVSRRAKGLQHACQ